MVRKKRSMESKPNMPKTEAALAKMNVLLAEAEAALTETQRRRTRALLAGDSTTAIAKAEGVTPQAVSDSLRSKPAQVYFRIASQVLCLTIDGRDLAQALTENLVRIALDAKLGVSTPTGVQMVADYRLRYEASLKLLSMLTSEESERAVREASMAATTDEATLHAREVTNGTTTAREIVASRRRVTT